eukprot:scaffold3890_cov41-Phaeocystis_antarctica.AAC.1
MLLRCMPHRAHLRVGCAARLLHPACDGRARCSDACRITHPLSRRGELLAFLTLPATAGLAAQMSASHLLA